MRGWVGFAYRGSRGHPPTCPYLVGLAEEAPTHPKTLHGGLAKKVAVPLIELHCNKGLKPAAAPLWPLRIRIVEPEPEPEPAGETSAECPDYAARLAAKFGL